MVISKILHMKDTGSNYHGRHLARSIKYICNPEKTQDGRLVMGINCQVENAFNQMKETKEEFGKIDKRQGYHIVLSFEKGEADVDTIFDFAEKFIDMYLQNRYEAVFAVHDNTDHPHAHIIFNSVSYIDGQKYRYKKGDWDKDILPIVNRLCEEYGITKLKVNRDKGRVPEWNEYKNGKFVWGDMIKRDIDACILQAATYEAFLDLLSDKGYEIKNATGQGKYLAIKPMGMSRYKRCKTLGDEYSEERIRQRIEEEDFSMYQRQKKPEARLIYCRIRRYRRAKISGIQKKYYAKLYRTNKLRKKPYSQAWKYKDDIKRLHKLQQQYLFLVNYDIHTMEEFALTISSLKDSKKVVTREKSHVYKTLKSFDRVFAIGNEMDEYKEAESCYNAGNMDFTKEHEEWNRLENELKLAGYSYDEIQLLEKHYKESMRKSIDAENAVKKEIRIAESIQKDFVSDEGIERQEEKEIIQEKERRQPIR